MLRPARGSHESSAISRSSRSTNRNFVKPSGGADQYRHTPTQSNDDSEGEWRRSGQMLLSDDLDEDLAAAAALRDYRSDHLVAANLIGATRTSRSQAKVNDYQRPQISQTDRSFRVSPAPRSPEPRATPTRDLNHKPDEEEEDDNNSSISFAQSGCHSILSAWRLKANRANRSSGANRPNSVLSMASSYGKKSAVSTATTTRGKSPASQTRIPLGPKGAQQFVTNSRRRRRANELILTTLEARRRALAANRQNVSLWGSDSYLNVDGFNELSPSPFLAPDEIFVNRTSLSPSPMQPMNAKRSQSPASQTQRSAHSDLGYRLDNQRNRLSNQQQSASQQKLTNVRPPLAKLDQNSSDLNSPNSSSASSYSSSSSSGSQFTQLVTRELAPDCVLLDEEALRPRLLAAVARNEARRHEQLSERQTQYTNSQSRVPPSKRSQREPVEELEFENNDSDQVSNGNFRRGALKRDSIRRLRLNRQTALKSSEQNSTSSSMSSSNDNPAKTSSPKRLAVAPSPRRRTIEENPFLNRHHFRTSSTRESNQREPQVERRARVFSGVDSERESRDVETKGNLSCAQSASSEQIPKTAPPTNKLLNPEADVKQVEQMLRQLKPNQVFTSYIRETQTIKSQGISSRESPSVMKSSKNPVPMKRQTSTSHSNATSREQPVVRESNKSLSDLRFDALGNRNQRDVETKWRHEQISSTPKLKEIKTIGQHIETLRSSSISPPAQFADTKSKSYPSRPQPPPTSVKPKIQELSNQRKVPQVQVPPRVSPRRALSEERPPVAARTTRLNPNQRLVSRDEHTKYSQVMKTENLPKFERTADDEFRKRVDYLRRLAKANLADSMDGKEDTQPKRNTKPMTTNWTSTDQSDRIELRSAGSREDLVRSPTHKVANVQQRTKTSSPIPPEMSDRLFADDKWRLDPLTSQTSAIKKNLATTNLDLLADRYQAQNSYKPFKASAYNFGRSNSSLASISSPLRPSVMVHTREREKDSVSSARSDLSVEPVGPAAVKLVVREKVAPKLNYAIVEQQSAVQQVRQVAPNIDQKSSSQVPQANSRAPLRIASPKSPDFNAMAASSNDDSAIASSVSSPSLSYMITGAGERQLFAGQNPAARAQSQQPTASARLNSEGMRSSNLQSILRRQQQMQLSGDSSDSSVNKRINLEGESIIRTNDEVTLSTSTTTTTTSSTKMISNIENSCRQVNAPIAYEARGSPTREMSPECPAYEEQGQRQQQKRVHFNDRTSVRSFESISSLASNSTAIPNEELRQQVGSPDSMGSGSTSRLSTESPDMRKATGAAIYAIRGDPELEPMQCEPRIQQQVHLQQQTMQTRIPPQQQPITYVPSTGYIGHQPQLGAAPLQSQQQFVRMTAPPSISSGSVSPQGQYLRQIPLASQGQQVILGSSQPRIEIGDDEDMSYAMRLRQAATSRVFSYGPQQMLASPSQFQAEPSQFLPPRQPMVQLQHQNQHQQQQTRPQVQQNRPTRGNLLSYHTEV